MAKPKTTRDAMEILKSRFDLDLESDADFQDISQDYRIAQLIRDSRKSAGLTQESLAKMIGTTQSVISQLEDADYEGHSLSMLRRIAKALHLKLQLRFVPDEVA